MNSGKVLVHGERHAVGVALGRHEANAQPGSVTPSAIAAQPAPAQPAGLPDQAYILGPEDVVQVDVLGRTDFTTRTKIGADGKGPVAFARCYCRCRSDGASISRPGQRCAPKRRVFNRPIVDVQVASYASRDTSRFWARWALPD